MTDDLHWDPFDRALNADPHAIWRRMRDEQPVYRNEKFDFVALSRYGDVDEALLDPESYSSAHGTILELMSPEPMKTGHIIFMDPPSHTTLRVLVSRAFTPRRIAALEDYIRDLCVTLLDAQIGSGGFDYMQDYAAQLPSLVISQLMGVDPADRELIRRTIDQTFHLEEGKGMRNDVSVAAQVQLHTYFIEQIEARRTDPRDDMMTDLVQAEVKTPEGTRRLSTAEAANFANLLVSAGTETTARLLGWACALLAAHPDQRAELAADPSLLANAVEETLRRFPAWDVDHERVVHLHTSTVRGHDKLPIRVGSPS